MQGSGGDRLIRSAKNTFAGSLAWMLGRRNLARLARLLANRARLDVDNDIDNNGERLVQRVVLANFPRSAPLHAVDVGAHIGNWSAHLLSAAREVGRLDLDLYCFEPSPAALKLVEARLRHRAESVRIELLAAAASSTDGTAPLHLVGEASGVNSFYRRSDMPSTTAIDVPLLTLDRFAADRSIERLALIKCDTEGHDVEVIRGAKALLEARKIDVMQFEYNWRWIDSRHYLRDIFDLAEPLSYRVGKVTRKGIEFYRAWHEELESFREANYVLCAPHTVSWFPAVTWWNE